MQMQKQYLPLIGSMQGSNVINWFHTYFHLRLLPSLQLHTLHERFCGSTGLPDQIQPAAMPVSRTAEACRQWRLHAPPSIAGRRLQPAGGTPPPIRCTPPPPLTTPPLPRHRLPVEALRGGREGWRCRAAADAVEATEWAARRRPPFAPARQRAREGGWWWRGRPPRPLMSF